MNNLTNDTQIITALATPYGKSAVAVIRISGKGCKAEVQKFLKKPLSSGQMRYNEFRCGDFKENLMAVCFDAPRTYTGEESVELYPHGNVIICDKIISALTQSGVIRLAERGEFTRRAFLNGKINLMQCEALADVIDAETDEQLKYGNERYDGAFNGLKTVEENIKIALSTIEAVLHYSDEFENEEIDEGLYNDVSVAIEQTIQTLSEELNNYSGGRILNDGMKVVLIGSPNVGKSTLLNALTDSDRAIVTEIAGTTRDTIDSEFVYKGRKFVITDTAGLNETTDVVENIGIERAKTAAKAADAIVYVIDNQKTSTEVDQKVNDFIKTLPTEKLITVINKCDDEWDVNENYEKALDKTGNIRISAKRGVNVTAIKQKLLDVCPKMCGAICNHRQFECAKKALNSCISAREENKKSDGLEIVAAALYDCYSSICELFGEGDADENVIGAVFDRFCVGK